MHRTRLFEPQTYISLLHTQLAGNATYHDSWSQHDALVSSRASWQCSTGICPGTVHNGLAFWNTTWTSHIYIYIHIYCIYILLSLRRIIVPYNRWLHLRGLHLQHTLCEAQRQSMSQYDIYILMILSNASRNLLNSSPYGGFVFTSANLLVILVA